MSFINNYFSHIYVLNLDSEVERFTDISSRLDDLNIKFSKFSAYGKDNHSVVENFNKIKENKNALIKQIGAMGCLISHREIIKDAIKNNYENILILEDDAHFCFNFIEKINIIKLVPQKWNLLYLGASQHDWSQIKLKSNFYNAIKTDGTFAYAINKKAYNEILRLSDELLHPIDWYLRIYQSKNHESCFVLFPNLCIADVSSSSIRAPRDQVEHSKKMKWNLNNFNIKKKLNILWCKINKSNVTASNVDSLPFTKSFNAFANIDILQHNISGHPGKWLTSVYNGTLKVENIVEKYMNNNNPDLIICDSLSSFRNEPWSKFNVPLFSILVDQHSFIDDDQVLISVKNNFTLFHRYKFNNFHKDLSKKIKTIYLPHSVDTSIYKNLNLNKEIDLLQTGAISSVYVLRNSIKNFNFKKINYKFIERPNDDGRKKWPVGDEYISILNKSKFSLSCGSKYNYPVLKYFEIPACNSIIYGSFFKELEDLGFSPGKNFIEANTSNPDDHISKLLKNETLINDLYKNGMKLIKERHTNDIRAYQMIKKLRGE
jgi:GR25 family glycosyltransferase involved in LPS biosynthesis